MKRKMTTAIALFVLALTLTAGASQASAAFDIFLPIDGPMESSSAPPPPPPSVRGFIVYLFS